MMNHYLPKAEGTSDFIIIGSKTGFAAMIFAAAVLAIIAVCAIIFIMKKSRK